jgi:hypothetical protein
VVEYTIAVAKTFIISAKTTIYHPLMNAIKFG